MKRVSIIGFSTRRERCSFLLLVKLVVISEPVVVVELVETKPPILKDAAFVQAQEKIQTE